MKKLQSLPYVGVALLGSACGISGFNAMSSPPSAVQGAATEIVVDGTKQFQTIEGFGTCLISWEPPMAEWYKKPGSVETYANELGFNILRCNLSGEHDLKPIEDPSKISHLDPDFAKGNIRTPVFLQFGRELLKINPKAKIIGSVWSPPPWMKYSNETRDVASGSINGENYTVDRDGVKSDGLNRVRPDRYGHFSQWIAEMAKYYAANGVPLYAISASNEPQFTQDFESCLWTAKDLAKITGLTGALFARQGLGNIRFFGPETLTSFNWDNGPNYIYTAAFREDPLAKKALGFYATHGYADGVKGESEANSSAKFWSIIEKDKKPYWVTEGGTGGHNWPEPVKPGGVGLAIHNALVAGNASAFVPWQYAENAETEHHLMKLSGFTKKTHVVKQYSRYIPAGSRRVSATPAFGSLNVSAFVKGKDVTIVILNPGDKTMTASVSLTGVGEVTQFNVVKTSAVEDSKKEQAVGVRNGKVSLSVPGPGIVTLSTLK